MKSSKRKICQVLALVVSGLGATAAMAGPVVQGGGSSLVAPTINTEIANFSTSVGAFTYFSVGSGAGQNAFLQNQPTFFGAGVTGTVDFANSDAALLSSQISGYSRASTDGKLIQIPYIVTAIAIPVVGAPAVTSTTTPQTSPSQSHSIALNDDDLCGIFSGRITDWSGVANPEGGNYAAAPIKVVYRTDGSGTTELLTRHLSQVCHNTGSNINSNVAFVDSLTFTDSFGSSLPSNFVGASGSGGVRNAVLNTTANGATVAYLSPDYTNTLLAPQSSVVTSASAAQLQVASLVNATDGKYYAPNYTNATTALGSIKPPVDTKARASNQLNWVPAAGNPVVGYPVSGTSQIILSQCYQDASKTNAVATFIATHFTNPNFAAIVHGNGFDTVPSLYQQAISDVFVSDNLGYGLSIGNSTACSTVTGR
ncbi:substrate-binding domain-containing protein [Burkholderia sp. Ac-20379]|uniref:substrate-binding domain-containing protein n=1 Tax=Burkholderia sp. Ac-20379 TaxID=2703900 RepID=UPI00197FC0D5|nr:substrate-binding domain-containing protein [Burkholderia sp. Ac-20379]MBN3724064.1 phosphate ABC transporter substrate-binding protein [Burkholderia sp. Ac-20379]